MSLTRSIAHNTIVQALGRVVSTFLTLVVFLLIARYLGVERYGEYTTALAFLQLFGLVVDLGLYIYLAKSLGEPGVNPEEVSTNVFSLRLVSAVLIIGLAPIVVTFFPYPLAVKFSVLVLSVSSIAVTATQALSGIFQHALRTAKLIGSEILGRCVLVMITLFAIRSHVGIIGISWTVAITSVLIFVLTFIAARRLVKISFRFDLAAWKKILSQTWPIALAIAFNVVYFKMDTIILSLYHTSREVGIYGAPYRILEALTSVPAMIGGLLTPLLAAAYASDRQRFSLILQRGFELLLFIALPLTIGTQFVATKVMSLIAPDFSESGTVLRLLMLAIFSIFMGYLFSNTVVVVNKQRVVVWVYGAVAALSVILYFIFIPRFSYYGAASVTILVETLMALAGAFIVLRTSHTTLQWRLPLKMVVASIGMAIAMYFSRLLSWVLCGTIGVLAYVFLAYLLGVINRQLLADIFSRKR